ncbi:NGG1p interacting factor NIF3 [Desulfolutivibrio sulfoxidireducens]|nr:Nif3-like dinuclear metal center hexameric protein [Desulfolutivibrio sulfoxidireducens]QLA18041.1 NGG1p interacting factor NIF3 [Desulfolutivibrio sulfoxidireducens]QLA20104.1 NGG1p interacting factor NIF3 [Desulfolutivibrio sulfoxidireducens]
MLTTEIIRRIERAADPRHAAAWDTSGIQIAGLAESCSRLAVALDPSPDTARAALAWGAGFLLTHHPLLLTPRLPDRVDDYHQVLRLMLGQGAWLYAAHTSLDVRPDGPAGWPARAFSLKNVAVLEVTGEMPGERSPSGPDGPARPVGFGLAGDLPEPLPFADFFARLGDLTGRDFFTLAGEAPARVARAAFCPGSGAGLAEKAATAGADVFVTGDLKYHQAAPPPLPILDVGHFCLEERMMRIFAETLAEELGPAGVEVKHFPGRDPLALCLVGRPSALAPE